MATDPGRLDSDLARARIQGDPRQITQALRTRADHHLSQLRFAAALVDLDEAARIHQDEGQQGEQARCLHLGATTSRLAGDLDGAQTRATVAIQLVEDTGPVAVSAWTELGETAFARADNLVAAQRYDIAVERAAAAGMLPVPLAELQRRRAQAWAAAGHPVRAASALVAAKALAEEAPDPALALRIKIEEAGAWLGADQLEHAELVIEDAGRDAGRLEDDMALADLELLRSTIALRRGDPAAALAAARSARALALSAVHPVAYTAAAVAMSELADHLGDRALAYEALAVGWATLGDLLGKDVGKSTFGPKLQELVGRWGEPEFVRVRDAYSERRRAEARG